MVLRHGVSASRTTVQITTETRDRLIALGGMNDSYEDVIKRLLDERDRLGNEWRRLSGQSKRD